VDFINRSYAQLVELFRSMTPAARVTTGLLLAVIVVSLGYLLTFSFQGSGAYLFGGQEFSERNLQQMEAAFAKAGLKNWKRVGNRLQIPRGQEHAFVAALADSSALPKDFNSIFDEAASGASPFESPKARELRVRMLRQKYLSLVLNNLPNIEQATVQFDEKRVNGFLRKTELTAMAAVRSKGNKRISDQLVETIRYTVASAVAGLDPDHVTVTDLATGHAYRVRPKRGPGAAEDLFAERKMQFETYWQQKIYDALAMYPGVVVGVNVDLDPKVREQTSKLSYDPRPTALETSNSRKKTEQSEGGGRPGTDPNLVVGNRPRSAASRIARKSTSDEQREAQRAVAGHEQVVTETAPLVPKHVSASIAIPKSYLVRVWQAANPPKPGESPATPSDADLEQVQQRVHQDIQKTVVALLPPVPAGTSRFDHVTVHTFNDFPEPEPEPPGIAATAGSWLAANWQPLAMLGVALLGLLFFRNLVRSAPDAVAGSAREIVQDIPAELTVVSPDLESAADAESAGAVERTLQRRASTGDLRQELAELVREDPDTAASILRGWIGDAA